MKIGESRPRHRFLKTALTLAVVATLGWGGLQLWDRVRGAAGNGGKAEAIASTNVDEAERLLKDNKAADAIRLLEPLAKGHAPGGPRVLMALAKAEKQVGKPDLAMEHLKRATEEFPSSPEQPTAAAAYARALEEAGKTAEAQALYERVCRTAPRDLRVPALAGLGRLAEAKSDYLRARDLYRQAIKDAEWNGAGWKDAIDGLGRVNVTLIFSPLATPESQVYAVQKGDSLTSIGNKLNTTQGLLTRANGVDETTSLNVGQPLKYTPKDFRIVIERSTCRLFLLDKDGVFKVYRVGLGMPGHETSLGSFTIGNKQKDPIWHKPGAEAVPAGDPRNELGTRWMPLLPNKEGLPTDLGIHGTIAPETVGKYASHGCARLLPGEIEELFDLVVRGTPVDIVETFTPTAKA